MLCFVPAPELAEGHRRQGAGLVGVVGHWTTTAGDGGAITVDATRWNGTTSAAELARASERLFGAPNDAFVTNGSAAGAFPLAVAADAPPFSSGTLGVQFKLVAGASDQTAGIVFDLKPGGEYLFVRYNTKEGNIALWGYADGRRRVIARGEGTRDLPLGTWHDLTVTIAGRELRAGVPGDSTLQLTYVLEAEPSGRVGLWTKRDAVTSFRAFRVDAR